HSLHIRSLNRRSTPLRSPPPSWPARGPVCAPSLRSVTGGHGSWQVPRLIGLPAANLTSCILQQPCGSRFATPVSSFQFFQFPTSEGFWGVSSLSFFLCFFFFLAYRPPLLALVLFQRPPLHADDGHLPVTVLIPSPAVPRAGSEAGWSVLGRAFVR